MKMKLYIAVLDEVPDHMVPVLVAHSVLNAHMKFQKIDQYVEWLEHSFRKCVLRVNVKEFENIKQSCQIHHLGHENTVMNAEPSCIIPLPMVDEDRPNVLKFAKLWKPL